MIQLRLVSATVPVALLFLAALFSGCATSQKTTRDIPPAAKSWDQVQVPAKGREGAHYQKILGLFRQGNTAEASKEITAFETRYKRSSVLPYVLNIKGLIALSSKKTPQAIHLFRRALGGVTDETFKQYFRFNLAAAEYEAGRLRDAFRNLDEIDVAQLDVQTRLKYHYVRARIYDRSNMPPKAAAEILEGSLFLGRKDNSKLFESFEKQLEKSIALIQDTGTLESMYQDYRKGSLADRVLFQQGRLALRENSPGKAREAFERLVGEFPNSPRAMEASDFLRTLRNQSVVNTKTVGVLLPMTGRFAKFGERALRGVELAFRIYNEREPDSKVTLIVEDSGETPEQAIAALDRLYFDHHVVAVIGPLLSKGVGQVAERAQDLGVPMIHLAQKGGEGGGDYVFHSAVTVKDQAHEIARYAIQDRGLKRIAMLYPDNSFGREYSDHFWEAVEKYGGEIVGVETYPPDETDFRKPVDKLVGLFYQEARHRELEALKKLREENGITRRTRQTEQYFKLKPVVAFDAVFIPEDIKALGQILPTFAYRDVESIQYLGVGTWNSQRLLARAGKYAEGALFVDAFYPESAAPEVQRFSKRYEATFQDRPETIEAFSFDAASILDQVLLLSGASTDRGQIKSELQSVRDFPGVTGKIFYEDGQFSRRLKVLTVQNRKIVEVL